MHTHTQLACDFEGPAGFGSAYRQRVLVLWEIQNVGLPSHSAGFTLLTFLLSLALQTNTWSEKHSAQKQEKKKKKY